MAPRIGCFRPFAANDLSSLQGLLDRQACLHRSSPSYGNRCWWDRDSFAKFVCLGSFLLNRLCAKLTVNSEINLYSLEMALYSNPIWNHLVLSLQYTFYFCWFFSHFFNFLLLPLFYRWPDEKQKETGPHNANETEVQANNCRNRQNRRKKHNFKTEKKTKKKRHPDEWEKENGRTQKGGKLIHKKTKTGMDSEKMIPVHKRGK